MLSTSGFVDDVMFSHNGANEPKSILVSCTYLAAQPTVKFRIRASLAGVRPEARCCVCVGEGWWRMSI